jgi:hypothetical protein
MFAVRFGDIWFTNDTFDMTEFFGLVKFSTTGPSNFDSFKHIVLNSDEWRMRDDDFTIDGIDNYADYDTMVGSFDKVEVNLAAMPDTPPALPAFADKLERAWSEGVEEQSKYMFGDGAEGDDSSAFGDVMIGDLATQEGREVNVITSKVNGRRKHKVVLDLDYDAALIPTSTPGHFHLLIDKDVDEDAYEDFLLACHNIGLIADGNLNQWSMHRRQFLRLPHVRKSKEKRPKEPAPAMGLVHPF